MFPRKFASSVTNLVGRSDPKRGPVVLRLCLCSGNLREQGKANDNRLLYGISAVSEKMGKLPDRLIGITREFGDYSA